MLYTVLRIAIKGEEHECNGQCIQTIFWLLGRIIDSLEVRYGTLAPSRVKWADFINLLKILHTA